MTRQDLIDMAKGARFGNASALSSFKKAMKRAGYKGRRGGWIYTPGAERASWQGWQTVASRVMDGYEPAVIRRVLEAHTKPQA
jgi:hypothetical protein